MDFGSVSLKRLLLLNSRIRRGTRCYNTMMLMRPIIQTMGPEYEPNIYESLHDRSMSGT